MKHRNFWLVWSALFFAIDILFGISDAILGLHGSAIFEFVCALIMLGCFWFFLRLDKR